MLCPPTGRETELSARVLEKKDLAAVVGCEKLALEKVDDDFQASAWPSCITAMERNRKPLPCAWAFSGCSELVAKKWGVGLDRSYLQIYSSN